MTEREVRNTLYPVRHDSAVTPLGWVESGSPALSGLAALSGVVVGTDTAVRSEPVPRVFVIAGWDA